MINGIDEWHNVMSSGSLSMETIRENAIDQTNLQSDQKGYKLDFEIEFL